MIKRIFIIGSIAALASCGNGNTSQADKNIEKENSDDIASIEMFRATDCATCHKKNETFVGPSFSDIAMRYTIAADTTVSMLAKTIINGSSGKWKNMTGAMPPHPSISEAQAVNMVKYILEVKK